MTPKKYILIHTDGRKEEFFPDQIPAVKANPHILHREIVIRGKLWRWAHANTSGEHFFI